LERFLEANKLGSVVSTNIRICDFKNLLKGIGISGAKIFILSEKQYQLYKNKKYCEIIKERIDEEKICL
jgi:hypothetical protein